MSHIAVRTGVPDEADAEALSRTLVKKRIPAGTRITDGVSHYRWEGEVHERHYWTVTAFTTTDELPPLYELVERSHSDDLPGITYTEIDASEEYLDWTGEQTAEPA